ncbi:SH3 domain-binding protein 4-like [Sinocyclocheilus rhinocerous]|uniref:SH3 domain-binding protein 4-like n=1 Tax=Sinocyclocheilus rhinocerous TaxID=307959 RepID=UPI0007B7E115|nr:PREDICTED: SH3 domain-binding protein 4-like [Sinocyclocheilus rhinocerous]
MAAHRIRSVNNNTVLPRCRSEGALIDLSEGVPEATLTDFKVPSPSALRLDATASFGAVREVIAIKDYCPSSFTTLKFSKGDCLYVIDTSGEEWWYAHNSKEMGYIPAAYVQPINYRDFTFSDSGMIDSLSDISEGVREMDISGEWTGSTKTTESNNDHPFVNKRMSTNPFLNGTLQGAPDQNSNQNSANALCLDNLSPPISNTSSTININGFESGLLDTHNISPGSGIGLNFRRDNPFFMSKRCYSMSELSVLQSLSDGNQGSLSFFGGLKSPKPEHFQSREDFKTAWLNHRKLTRSCHDLDSIGQNPGWGQTQPIEANIVCKLDSSGGAVQLPNTSISIYIPEGHVAPGETQQISLKALLDPPLELNNDRCTTVSPVVEVKLSNMETKTPVALEMKVSVVVKIESRKTAEVVCVRSDFKEGPYVPIPHVYMYGDTVQVTLDNLEPCMYVSVVAQAQTLAPYNTVWEHVVKKVTLGVYGPKHIHPSFNTVVAIFGHDCSPKTLLVSDVKKHLQSTPPVVLQLWGKHQFVLTKPQDLQVGMYSNMSNFDVRANEQARTVRGFQIKLGKVARLIYMIAARDSTDIISLYVELKRRSREIQMWFWTSVIFIVSIKKLKPSSKYLLLRKYRFGKNIRALLKMDCQGLVARLVMDFVLLTTAVEVAGRWRELAERLATVSRQQMEAYEAPHRDSRGQLDSEAMWKPAFDFLVTWAAQVGDSYRDVIQELHTGLDKMKNPITKRWRHITGSLMLVNCLDLLRSTAFSPCSQDDCAI